MTIGATALRVIPAPRWTLLRPSLHWSLARQYLLASFLVVIAGVVITGAWIGHQIESSVIARTAGITALYVDSVLSPNLQALARDDRWIGAVDTAALNRLVATTGLGQGVAVFKIWSLDARVLYSADRALVGRQFPVGAEFTQAAAGEVSADMSDLGEPENTNERQHYRRLVEVYAPVREVTNGRVIAINEFYLLPDALEAEIRDAQLRSWAVVGVLGVFTYLLLAGIVKRGSDTIGRQQRELVRRLDQIQHLHERVRRAADRTTALNEQALRRISADLHDGPGQALALALLRLDALQPPGSDDEGRSQTRADFETVHAAVRDALSEVRAISAGLRLPELGPLSVADVVARAINDHSRRSGVAVEQRLEHIPVQAPLPIKIALLRTLQEALSNATRHGRGQAVHVFLRSDAETLQLSVTDRGPGFDPGLTQDAGRLGLAGMRERAELLGGSFEVLSAPGKGAEIRVRWPLSMRAQV